MVTCSAIGCVNRSDRNQRRGVTFHKFPADPGRRELWIQAVQRGEWQPALRSVLCSAHFKDEDFDRRRVRSSVRLRPGAIPSKFPDPTTKSRKSLKAREGAKSSQEDFSLSAKLCEISASFLAKEDSSNILQQPAGMKRRKPDRVPKISSETYKSPTSSLKKSPTENLNTLVPHKFLEVQIDNTENTKPDILSRVISCNKSLSVVIKSPNVVESKLKQDKSLKISPVEHDKKVGSVKNPLAPMPYDFLEVQLTVLDDQLPKQVKLFLNSKEISIKKISKS